MAHLESGVRRSRRLPGLRVVPYQPSASAPIAQAFTTGGAKMERDAKQRIAAGKKRRGE